VKEIRIGLVGYRGIGKVHSLGYRSVRTFFHLDAVPVMKVLCGRDEEALKKAALGYGWESHSVDWREIIRRKDVDLIDICTPPFNHNEIAKEAAKAGKDIICEKPLARSLPEALEMLEAVYEHGVRHMTAFNYRCVPAVRLAKELIDSGEIGEVFQWRAHWLSDLLDPALPLSWFYQKEKSGSGALQDIGSHLVDLAHYLVGPVEEVSAVSQIFIPERLAEKPAGDKKKVDVEDAVQFIARFSNGAMGSFEASRVAGGYRDEFEIQVNGSKGTVRFNSKVLHKLEFYTTEDEKKRRGPHSIFVGNEQHPYGETMCPYGEVIGRNDLFIIQAYELLNALAKGVNPATSFLEGARCQAVLDAVLGSARRHEWSKPEYARIEQIKARGGTARGR
jgi:predicted dehydrogenase